MIDIVSYVFGAVCVLGCVLVGALFERAGFFDWWHGE